MINFVPESSNVVKKVASIVSEVNLIEVQVSRELREHDTICIVEFLI